MSNKPLCPGPLSPGWGKRDINKIKHLVIDIGNTSITWAVYNRSKLITKNYLPTKNFKIFKFPSSKDLKITYASVVPKVDNYFKKHFQQSKFKQLNYTLIPEIKVALKNKKEIGIDRLVNAAGAVNFYGAPAIIIDFGTATTFCVIDQKKVYQGGLICPGINLTRQVLHEKTAKLPLIEITPPRSLIGKNTVEAMQAGIFFGYQSLTEGILERLKNKLGKNYKVIATGGYANLITKGLKQKINIIDQDLTLKSLNYIGKSL